MYTAIVCRIKNVRPHSNANVLKLATVQGYQIIVGMDQEEDELGVFFLSDGALSEEHCLRNNLYIKHPDTDAPMGGYFGPNGRVKAIKLRGEISEGFWQPIKCFEWTGPTNKLVEEYEFDTLNGYKICQKYYTPATLRAMNKNKPKKGRNLLPKVDRSMLREHYSTKQVRHNMVRIPVGAYYSILEKLHGTSGRTGRILTKYLKYNKFKSIWNNTEYIPFKFNNKPKVFKEEWEYVSGSRRVVLDPKISLKDYNKVDSFRINIHEVISSIGLHKGEVLYYEIVGFNSRGGLIIKPQALQDKELKKLYGNTMAFTYGCSEPQCEIYVYRITHINEDGVEIDLPMCQVESRCEQLGLYMVPLLEEPCVYDGDREAFVSKLFRLSEGPSVLDPNHIREGVVVRVEHKNMFTGLKFKSSSFCELEGIMKNDPNFVDQEEVS